MIVQTNTLSDVFSQAFDKENLNFKTFIGGTTYEVCSHFNVEGKQSILEQFKNLILSENLI